MLVVSPYTSRASDPQRPMTPRRRRVTVAFVTSCALVSALARSTGFVCSRVPSPKLFSARSMTYAGDVRVSRRAIPDGGGGEPRAGDWLCGSCGVNVFASKTKCFKCGTPKPGGAGASAGGEAAVEVAAEKVARVLPTSDPGKLGVTLAYWVWEDGKAVVKGMGANAANIMLKSAIRADSEFKRNVTRIMEEKKEDFVEISNVKATASSKLVASITSVTEKSKSGEDLSFLQMTMQPVSDWKVPAEKVEMKVGGQTNAGKLAGAILGTLKKGMGVEMVVVGAATANKALKAAMIGQIFLDKEDSTSRLVVSPDFATGTKEGKEISELRIQVAMI